MKVAGAGVAAVLAMLMLIGAVGTAVLGGTAPTLGAALNSPPSPAALTDIPAPYLTLYRRAADHARTTGCTGIDWALLAAVGKVETDHGRSPLPGVSSGENEAGAAVISGRRNLLRHVRCRPVRRVAATYPLVARHVDLRSAVMIKNFRAEKAVSPGDGAESWVVVNDAYELHAAGCAFLAGLRGRDRSVNTERLYAGRVALFLSWCARDGVDWQRVGLGPMVRFKRWLVTEPLPSRRRDGSGPTRHRSEATADAVLGTVCEFLRFCARYELIDPAVARGLHETRYLRYLPPGYDAGEDEQFRTVRSRMLTFVVPQSPFEFLEPGQVDRVVAAAGNPRDRCLVALVAMTGIRIGEALGLHRQDMHLLADSRGLGCATPGPHLHVRRRAGNANRALAKSRFPRSIPVPDTAIDLYADYAHERARRLGTAERNLVGSAGRGTEIEDSPLVFVNLYRPPLGAAMGYANVKEMFDRLAVATGLTVRPHLLRHTAATTWLRQGTSRDTVQALLGHVSPSSMQPYLHPDESDKRAAVEAGAAWAWSTR